MKTLQEGGQEEGKKANIARARHSFLKWGEGGGKSSNFTNSHLEYYMATYMLFDLIMKASGKLKENTRHTDLRSFGY